MADSKKILARHRTAKIRFASALVMAVGCLWSVPAWSASDGWWVFNTSGWRWADPDSETVHSVAVFAGEGTERNFSDTLKNLFNYEGSTDRMAAVAGGRRIAWFKDQFSIDAELFYARHYGRERYHEVGATAYVRWQKFSWNDSVVTTFAVGVGPSYTTIYPKLEAQALPEDRSKILNQFNLELTLALPEYRRTSLVGRLQHRSGIFGAINGVWDASNFLTLGLRQEF